VLGVVIPTLAVLGGRKFAFFHFGGDKGCSLAPPDRDLIVFDHLEDLVDLLWPYVQPIESRAC